MVGEGRAPMELSTKVGGRTITQALQLYAPARGPPTFVDTGDGINSATENQFP